MLKSKMRIVLAEIIEHKKEMLECHSRGKDNPQIKELYDRTSAEITAFQSVLDALFDNDIMLRIYLPRIPDPDIIPGSITLT